MSADDLVRDHEQKVSARTQAKRFLRELLADGPHRAAEVFQLADDADISVPTLKRAKKDLGVDSFQRKTAEGKPEWWWVLPEEEEPPPAGHLVSRRGRRRASARESGDQSPIWILIP